MRIFSALVILCIATLISSCSFRGIHTRYDLPYLAEQNAFGLPELLLDVYSPKKVNDAEVLIFIHGGSWNSGHKETYRFFGKRMARRGVVAVIINYPLSPAYQIQSMVTASKLAADWTYKNISEYGGSPEKIFVSGHSAGGHLASVIAVREELFVELGTVSPIKGAVLIDAAGFDMKWFLEQMNYEPGTEFLIPFTDDPEVWKEVSPIYFLSPGTKRQLILMGEKTLPGIKLMTERYLDAAEMVGNPVVYELQKNKKHRAMIVQFINTLNPVYKKVLDFMRD